MKEDPSLFKYELAFTIIIKDAARYMKEWIDFHRLAGVDHFYFYDNESSDNLKEVLQPYIDKGIVEYETLPGKRPQSAAYSKAVKDHRFDCRYMGFIDDDEYVYCTDHNKTIKDLLHEVLDNRKEAVGLTLNLCPFGSSGHEKADYNVGVLDRFMHCAGNKGMTNDHPKNISNPRAVELVENPHYINHFDGKFSVNSNGQFNAYIGADQKLNFLPPVRDKIRVNHYPVKSREEWLAKLKRGDAYFTDNPRTKNSIDGMCNAWNEAFDDEIIKYRDARRDLIHGGGYTKRRLSCTIAYSVQ